jgi:hypothetical protein
MLQQLRKIVLMLMMAMILLSPFMQLDSWDNFPTSTDDLELQLIFGLCLIGMFLVFVGVAKLLPQLISSAFLAPSLTSDLVEFEAISPKTVLSAFTPPLRI